MSATVRLLRVVESAPGSVSASPAGRGSVRASRRALAFVVVAGLGVAGMVHAAGAEARALRGLPQPARAQLYTETVQNLGSLCLRGGPMAWSEYCQEQARIALALPECDAGCARIARAALRTATR